MDELLKTAFKDMPGDIVKAPAYALKDALGRYAIKLPAHIVVAVTAPYGHTDGSVVSILRGATDEAEGLGYEVIVYVASRKKYYLTTVSHIKKHYTTVARSTDRHAWVMPLKRLTEYSQAKADAMQGVLLL